MLDDIAFSRIILKRNQLLNNLIGYWPFVLSTYQHAIVLVPTFQKYKVPGGVRTPGPIVSIY
jgi:hypothetical protein